MVFEKITIFEPHLEGARFGPTFGEREEREAEDEQGHGEDESGGRSRLVSLVVASLVVSVIATVLARRYLGEDDEYEVEQVELDESVDESIDETAE